jgi:hypothetical protein
MAAHYRPCIGGHYNHHCAGPCEEDDTEHWFCLEKTQGGAGRKSNSITSSKKKCCARQTTKKYTTRPSPPYPAQECKGRTMRGNDGNTWTSLPASNGVYRWKPVKADEEKPSKRMSKQAAKKSLHEVIENVKSKLREVRRMAIAEGVRKRTGLPSLDQVRRLHTVGMAQFGKDGTKYMDEQLNVFYVVQRGNKLEWREAKTAPGSWRSTV